MRITSGSDIRVLAAISALFVLQTGPVAAGQEIAAFADFTAADVRRVDIPDAGPYRPAALGRPMPGARMAELDRRFADVVARAGATGISAAILRPDEGLWTGAAGSADIEAGIELTSTSPMHAGSIGKVLTASLVFRQVEAGRLHLDDTIEAWYPGFPDAARITIGNLLEHTAGIYSFNWDDRVRPLEEYFEPARLVAVAARQGNWFEPGERWSYSNTGYLMLGEIAGQLGGHGYDDAIEELIDELELPNSAVLRKDAREHILVRGYDEGSLVSPAVHYESVHGAGIVATTATDLVHMFHALWSGEIVAESSRRAMLARLFPMGTGMTWYGRGIIYMESPLGPMLYFAGRIVGFGAMVGYLPEQDTYVAVMVNDDTPVDPAWYALLHELP